MANRRPMLCYFAGEVCPDGPSDDADCWCGYCGHPLMITARSEKLALEVVGWFWGEDDNVVLEHVCELGSSGIDNGALLCTNGAMELLARDDVARKYRRVAAEYLVADFVDLPSIPARLLADMHRADALRALHCGIVCLPRMSSTPTREREVEDWIESSGKVGSCRRQVTCSTGIADIVTDSEVIEVKLSLTGHEVRRAAGQAIAYAGALDKRPAIAGVVRDIDDPFIRSVAKSVRVYAVPVTKQPRELFLDNAAAGIGL